MWKCNYLTHVHGNVNCRHVTQKTLFTALLVWLQLCGVEESAVTTCFQFICQLELFDRLGMKHTCCNRRYEWPGHEMWREMKSLRTIKVQEENEDEQEILEEDSHSQEQLDLLMHAYKAYPRQHDGDVYEFWKAWWKKVDVILPEPHPAKRCSIHGMLKYQYDWMTRSDRLKAMQDLALARAEQDREALAACGYSGLDFLEVIKRHFADVLDPPSVTVAPDICGDGHNPEESLHTPSDHGVSRPVKAKDPQPPPKDRGTQGGWRGQTASEPAPRRRSI